jgi:exonuclease SbcD
VPTGVPIPFACSHPLDGSVAMRILHTADWHLGKLLHGVHLTDDQRGVLHDLCDRVAEHAPDVVLMAGDVYDRSVPPAEAVSVLDETLARLVVDLETPVVLIAGNHDSPDRLEFGSRILRERGLHVFSALQDPPGAVTLHDDHGPVHVVGLPYAEPSMARHVFGDPDIRTHDDVLKAQTDAARARLPAGERSVAVAHVFAQGGCEADSERKLAVGGADTVHTARFDGFDYVALGHLHRRQTIAGDPRIRYAGSLMKYSFDEVAHAKSAALVDLDATGAVAVEPLPLTPARDLRKIEGTLAEIEAGPDDAANADDYVWVRLLDDGPVVDAMSRIRAVYPNALHVEQPHRTYESTLKDIAHEVQSSSVEEVFAQFFTHVLDRDALNDAQADVLHDALDRLRHDERYG